MAAFDPDSHKLAVAPNILEISRSLVCPLDGGEALLVHFLHSLIIKPKDKPILATIIARKHTE